MVSIQMCMQNREEKHQPKNHVNRHSKFSCAGIMTPKIIRQIFTNTNLIVANEAVKK